MFTILLTILVLIIIILITASYIQTLYCCLRKIKIENAPTASKSTANTFDYLQQPPGPMPWPVIGNLNAIGQCKTPFEALTNLSKVYGGIYSLTLGTTRCVVVNNLELIREVLNQNGKFFGGRPDFLRYHKLFGGDRNNSLALCDWSHLQQRRRNLARRHCSPRDCSSFFMKMSEVGCLESSVFMDKLQEKIQPGQAFQVKPLLQQACANMFLHYMCSTRFDYEDTEFQSIVEYFDQIFWEINQGYAVDFLPWLAPFYKGHMKKIVHWSTTIRKFILERIVDTREHEIDLDEPERDFTDALLKSLIEDKNVSRDTIIFMLEDFIGGHSAVGNLVMLSLTYVALHPHLQEKIQKEIDFICKSQMRGINLSDMENMPFTLATIFEVLRYSSSPIVPHVASEDAMIAGYGIPTGTIVFINNYNLNTSSEYWSNPEIFDPSRFLEKVHNESEIKTVKRRNSEGSDSGVELDNHKILNASNTLFTQNKETTITMQAEATHTNTMPEEKYRVKKNIPHFLPFSIGKRTCIGQNLVRGFGFLLLANILQKYNVHSNDVSTIKQSIQPACVALPAETFPLTFTLRT